MRKNIMVLLFCVLLFSAMNVSAYANSSRYTSGLISIDVKNIDNVFYMPIREFSDETMTNIDYYKINIGYYNKILYVDDGITFSKHNIGSKEVYKNKKIYNLENNSLIIDEKLYIPLDMIKIITDIDEIIIKENKAIIKIKYRNDKDFKVDEDNNRTSEITYLINDEYGKPLSNVSVNKYVIPEKDKSDSALTATLNPNTGDNDLYYYFHINIGTTDSNGYFTEKTYEPILNEQYTRLKITQPDKKLIEYFIVNYTPQTNVINLTLSDDSKYLSGELPTVKDYYGFMYKMKYSFTFRQIKIINKSNIFSKNAQNLCIN